MRENSTTLPKPTILENSDQKLSQGPKAPSDLEDISPKTTATKPSNQEPHDTAAVFSIAPNENANLFFHFVNLFLFLLFVAKFLFYFVVIFNFLSIFVMFLQKSVKNLVTCTEADVNQDPPDTTAVSIASNDNENHRLFIAGLSSGVEGMEQEKVPEQIQDTEPAAPSPGEHRQKRNEQSQYHSSGKLFLYLVIPQKSFLRKSRNKFIFRF